MEDGYVETKVEALQDNRVKVTVTVDAKEIDDRIKKTYKDFAYKYNFPGFRRGKAPRPVIDNALGAEAVRATVTDAVVNETYPLVVDENDLYPTGKPEFEDGGLVESGKPYAFEFTLAVKPELELSSYDAVEVELPAEGASDAEIDEQVESLREHYYTFKDASAATKIKEGGFAELAMKAADDAGEAIEGLSSESRIYGLGSGLFPEAFDQELVGMKKGQEKSFSIDVPAGSSTLMAQVAGKTEKVAFEVEVKVVKTKELPEVTDEWAKETLGFENVADLRSRIADSIAQQKSDILPRMKENACLAVLAGRLEGEVPQGMAEDAEASLLQDFFQQLQRQNMTFDTYLMQQNLTSEQFKEDVKQQALDMAKQDLALDAWARHFGLAATPADVTAEFEKSGAEDPKALEEDWRKNGQLHLIRQGIARTNAMLDVMDKAKVTEVDLAAKDADAKAEKKPAKKAASKKGAKKDAEAPADAADGKDADAPAKKAAPKKKAAKKATDAPDADAAGEDAAAE